MSSGSIETFSAGSYKEVIPLAALSACSTNGFGVSIMLFPDITLRYTQFIKVPPMPSMDPLPWCLSL